MNPLKQFLKATIVGGVMFLVPVALVLVVLKHAMQFAARLAKPIAAHFPATVVGGIAVFMPQSPTPMSGNVMYVPAHRVQALQIGMPAAMKLVKSIGLGSGAALRGADLGPSLEP